MKTTNLLLIAGAVFLGYKLAPEEVKEQLTGDGGSTVVSISENPVDWSKLAGIITSPISEMPLPSMPEWFTKPPDWLDKIPDITLPKLPDVIPHIPSIEEIIDKIKFPAIPSIEEIIDKIKFPAMPDMPDIPDIIVPKVPDILKPSQPEAKYGGFNTGNWFNNIGGEIGNLLNNITTDIVGGLNFLQNPYRYFGIDFPGGTSQSVVPSGERRNVTEASLVPHTPVFSGRAPKYTAFMPIEHPGIKGVSIVGVLSGSPTPIGTLTGSLPPAKAKPWMFT